MGSTIDEKGKGQPRNRNNAPVSIGYAILDQTDLDADPTTLPVIISGSGAPTGTEAGGSIYLRTDGDGATTIYTRVSSTWVAGGEVQATMPVLAGWAVDGDGVFTNGAGMVGTTPALTEQAAALAVCYDAGNAEFNLLSATAAGTDYTADYQLFTDTKNDDDFVAFGGAVPFPEIGIDMSATVQTYTGDGAKWQYSQGSDTWADLTVAIDNTDATAQDGLRAFGRDGAISFVPPADWATDTINGQLGYWVRSIIVTNANVGTVGVTNSAEHSLVTPSRGWASPFAFTCDEVYIADAAATLHTAADVKFLLWNYTVGVGDELTFVQDIRTELITVGTPFDIDDGDIVGVVVTQEDGTNEPTGCILTLTGARIA